MSLGGGDGDSSRDADHGQQDHPPAGGGGTLAFRDDKQETMVVRPYPQVQTHSQPQATPQTVPIQPGTPVTVPAPSVHLPQGQPAVLTEGQMKVMILSAAPKNFEKHLFMLPDTNSKVQAYVCIMCEFDWMCRVEFVCLFSTKQKALMVCGRAATINRR